MEHTTNDIKPWLASRDNGDETGNIDAFNEMFNTTCSIISTFKGIRGKRAIATVTALVRETPELQQFLYELYFNTKAAARIELISCEQ